MSKILIFLKFVLFLSYVYANSDLYSNSTLAVYISDQTTNFSLLHSKPKLKQWWQFVTNLTQVLVNEVIKCWSNGKPRLAQRLTCNGMPQLFDKWVWKWGILYHCNRGKYNIRQKCGSKRPHLVIVGASRAHKNKPNSLITYSDPFRRRNSHCIKQIWECVILCGGINYRGPGKVPFSLCSFHLSTCSHEWRSKNECKLHYSSTMRLFNMRLTRVSSGCTYNTDMYTYSIYTTIQRHTHSPGQRER